eukprot:144030_1
MLSDSCCDPAYIQYPFRYEHLFKDSQHTEPSTPKSNPISPMDPNHKAPTRPKAKSKSFAFWKKTPSKTPGSIKQVRGAQYPPIMNKNNPYKISSSSKSHHKKRHSTSITLKVSSMSDSHLNYKHTNNPPLQNGFGPGQSNDDNATPQTNIDMNDLIQSVKQERLKQIKEFETESKEDAQPLPAQPPHTNNEKATNGHSQTNITKQAQKPSDNAPSISSKSPIDSSIDPSAILEWDEIKSEREAFARKNRNRINLLTKSLNEKVLDSNGLRRACWRGIPNVMRPSIWKLLLGYIPKNLSRRDTTLSKKRHEYYDLMERYYNQTFEEHRSDQERKILHQIGLDVPRTSPELKLFQIASIKKLLSRALYIWSLRHTATGYVQGINDLITPFVYIFLDEYLRDNYDGMSLHADASRDTVKLLSEEDLSFIEADSYWCLDYLIEGLQLNYTDNQPGIYNMVSQLEDVIKRVNASLYKHFEAQKIEIFQFSFRWMNCLLMRELSLENIIRLWDTYLCEGVELSAGFSEFHVFVC